jgi:hypothetical protein
MSDPEKTPVTDSRIFLVKEFPVRGQEARVILLPTILVFLSRNLHSPEIRSLYSYIFEKSLLKRIDFKCSKFITGVLLVA